MNDKVKIIYSSKLFDTPEKKEAFVKQMNLRFDVTIHLMESLKREINSPNQLVEGKTVFCAYKLIGYLDQFVEEMHNFIHDIEEPENSLESLN